MAKRWMAGALVAAAVLSGCSSDGGSDGAKDEKKTTTTAEPAPEATTTTEVDLGEVGEAYQDEVETADDAIHDELEVRDGFAAENDLDGAIDSSKDLRNELFEFDEAVRELEVPDDQASGVNEVLTETGRYIEALDGYVEVSDIAGYNEQLDAEADARIGWYVAVNELAEDLDVDGAENDIDAASESPSTDDTDDTDEEVPAGETIGTGTASMEVPEGFTATAAAVIEMTSEDGATLGLYNVYQDSADTLEEAAEASSSGAAEKNGYEVIGGPEEMEVGEYPALGYAMDDGEGNTLVDIYFEAEDAAGVQWHVISVVAPEDDIDAVMESVEAVLDTVVIS